MSSRGLRFILTTASLTMLSCVTPQQGAAETFSDQGFVSDLVVTFAPFTLVGMAWAPDGRLFVWQKNGVVRVVRDGSLLPTPFVDLSTKVNTFDDRGFWGLAFHPDFANNGYVYMSYAYEDGGNTNDTSPKTARLTRVTADPSNPDVALANSEVVILGSIGTPPCSAQPAGSDCIPVDGGSHHIGSIRFAADGTMFVGNGDGSDGDQLSLRAQDLDSWSGKILRIKEDGAAPGDNPFDNGANSIRSKVWLYGVRNPFRFALHPTTGEPYFGDVGWNTWEEINRGTRGKNYGWPCYEGTGPQPTFQSQYQQCSQLAASAVVPPLYTYDHSTGSAAIGGPFYTGTLYPEQYRNSFFFADYSGNFIRRMVLDTNGNSAGVVPFATGVQAPVTVEVGPDGMLYYLSFTTGQIRRIRFNGPSAVASATPASGYSPLTVSFSSAGSSDPSGGALTYLWDFGDGTTSTQASPVHVYTASGVASFTPKLTVRNSAGLTSSMTLKITVGSLPPIPTIQAPASGTPVHPGDVVAYQGSATDPEQGVLPASALKWTVLLHHNTHVHTFVGGAGLSGSFVAQDHGAIGTFSYEIVLTATDASGLSTSTSVMIPVLAENVPPSVPAALAATAVSGTQINLSWTASTDNVGVTGYRLERCQGTGCATFVEFATSSSTGLSDTGLAPGTSYSYRVRATDAAGNLSGYSNVATATTQPPDTTAPTAPGGLTATAVNAAQINLSWSASTDNVGVTGYRIERCQGASCANFVEVATSSAASFSNTGLSANTSYTYRVRANDAAGNLSAYSNVISATTSAGTSPTGLVAAYAFNEGSGTAVIDASGNSNTGTINGATWTAQGRFGAALTFNGVSNLVQIPASASLNVSSAMTLEAWIYPTAAQSGWRTIMQREVDAYFLNASNSSGALRPSGGGTFNGTVSFVSGTTANPVNAWTHVALTYDGATLRLYVNGVQAASQARTGAVQTTSNPLRIGGNSPYGEYFQGRIDEVRVYNRALSQAEIQTDMTTPVGPVAPDTTPPVTPSSLTATVVSSAQIALAWGASTDNVGVTGYRVERCQGAGCTGFAQIATPTGTTFTDTGLTAGASYSYRVLAVDAASNVSGYSGIASATTPVPDTTPPSTPTGLTVTAITTTQISLTWGASADNVAVTGYRLERCQGAGCTTFAQVATPSVTNFTDSGLVASTSYSYRVRATDAAGNLSVYSSTVTAVTQTAPDTTPPSAPTALATTVVSTSQVNLSWTASTDNVSVTGYQVDRCQGSACTTFVQVAAPTTTSFSDTGLAAGTTYRYRVRATDAAGNISTNSTIAAATTQAGPDTTPPSAPTGLATTVVSTSQINLSWTASTDNVGVTGYQVDRCQGSTCTAFVQIAAPTAASFSDTGLTAGTTYRYRVRATDAGGNVSTNSSIASATTQTAPDTTAPTAPGGLTATAVNAAQINLSWSASTDNVGVTGYRIERCQGASCANFVEVATSSAASFSNTGLSANTSYTYRVRANDAAGNLSAYSNVISATTSAGTSPTGLVAAYAFNEGSGTAVIDASGNSNTGTINGATWTAQGRFGAALTFNGVSNLVQIPASASLNVSSAMTLEAWIYPTAAQSGWRTIMQREVDAYFLNASNSSGALRPSGGGTFNGTVSFVSGTTANPVNAWTHVALTYDGATLRLYVNGVQAASQARTGAVQTTSNPLRIGGNSPYGEYFQGRIDEVRVYNRALSQAEIQTDMTTPVAQ